MRVKILKKIDELASGNWINKHVGKVFEVKDWNSMQWVRVDGEREYFWKNWVQKGVIEIMFEPKSGMIVERYDGWVGFFVQVKDTLKILWTDGDAKILGYDTFSPDFLTKPSYGKYKVGVPYLKKIYNERLGINFSYLKDIQPTLDIAWQYPQIQELTIKEIADKLKIPVEQLRIKD